jgi:hypothetical protein
VDEQIGKFERLARLSGRGIDAQAVVQAVRRMESLPSVHALMRLL